MVLDGWIFQSTPSAWRETGLICSLFRLDLAFQSTPSAWRETYKLSKTANSAPNFNPLPPHGGRHHFLKILRSTIPFQSTPSAWRETLFPSKRMGIINISIHSLRMEGDLSNDLLRGWDCDFNPLPPHGGRLQRLGKSPEPKIFQSTPSAWRETIS